MAGWPWHWPRPAVLIEAGEDELWDAGDSTCAADGQVQMKLMGKGNQVSEPENQITNAASPMN